MDLAYLYWFLYILNTTAYYLSRHEPSPHFTKLVHDLSLMPSNFYRYVALSFKMALTRNSLVEEDVGSYLPNGQTNLAVVYLYC